MTDLVDDLNQENPAILHFSGHGNSAELVFEDEAGNTVGLDNERLARLLDVAGSGVRLIVFNSCDSAAQAQVAVQHVELAIGMNTTIDDEDAKVFAGQLYSSIAAGRSVGEAFRQARFQLEVDGSGEGGSVPELYPAKGRGADDGGTRQSRFRVRLVRDRGCTTGGRPQRLIGSGAARRRQVPRR